MNKRGTLMVLSGPSGVGKSTVLKKFFEKEKEFYFSVSFTTRKPREGEVDGVNYNFVSREEFERMIANNELLEYAQYVDNYYGTSMKVINDHLNAGVDVMLDIEVQGAGNVKRLIPDAVTVFLLPPSFDELSRRLYARGTDTKEVIEARIERAKEEFKSIPTYDYAVVNDDVDRAVDNLQAILISNRSKTDNMMDFIQKEIMTYDA